MARLFIRIILAFLCSSCSPHESREVIIVDSREGAQIFFYKNSLKGGIFLLNKNGLKDINDIRRIYKKGCDYFVFSAKIVEDKRESERAIVFDRVRINGNISNIERKFVEDGIKSSMGDGVVFCFME